MEPRVIRHESELGRFERVECSPDPRLRGIAHRYCGYDHAGNGRPVRRREVAQDRVSLILGFGPPLGVGGPGVSMAKHDCFITGLDDSYAVIEHDALHGIQIDLSPIGAYMLFGVAMHELSSQLVAVEDILGSAQARELVGRLYDAPGWEARFALLDRVFGARLSGAGGSGAGRSGARGSGAGRSGAGRSGAGRSGARGSGAGRSGARGSGAGGSGARGSGARGSGARSPSPEVVRAWQRLTETDGRLRIGELTRELGCSRRHLAARFAEQVGVPPKVAARLLRFQSAVRRLGRDDGGRFAEIAQDCGYYDQAHLNRDFRELGGTTPGEFVAKMLPEGFGVAAE